MNGVYFPFNCMPLNKQINDVIYGKKNSKGTKNANKTKDLIKNKKEQIEEIKSDINKKKEKIVEKTEETKKEIDSRTKKATSKLDSLYSELKEKNKNNNKNEDVNTVSLQEYKYCIPLNFTTDSVFERAIITDIVYNKIKDSNILDPSLFSLKDDLNSSYDFFSIALNRNFHPQINLSLDIKEYDRVKKIVDSEKFKDFIDDIDITEKDFNAAKSRIENYLNSCKDRLNQYLTNLDTKNFRLNSTEMLKNARDGVLYLLHDFTDNDATVEALKTVIPTLLEQDYEFLTVTEIFKAKQPLFNEKSGYEKRPRVLFSDIINDYRGE